MTDFKKKVQKSIERVKGLKGRETSGWVKVPVGIEDNIYLDDPITKLKILGLQWHTNCMS